MSRQLKFNIFRYNPQNASSVPRTDVFWLDETVSLTLFIALNRIREEQDPSLNFDFACRMAICGSCGMVINGRPGLACRTLTSELPNEITLMPLPVFKLVGDLAVDTGTWFRMTNKKIKSWIHTDNIFDPEILEERMENELANSIFELERCIECGCCIASCGTVNIRPDFIGAFALNRIARFIIDPRDKRTDSNYFEVIGTDQGIFGCMGLLACDDFCPRKIPLQDQLGILRRKMAFISLKNLFSYHKL